MSYLIFRHTLFVRCSLLLVAWLQAMAAHAQDYAARLDGSAWNVEPSALECKLWQSIPNYGTAVFSSRSGEPLEFYLKPQHPQSIRGSASLNIVAPAWRSGLPQRNVGNVSVVAGQKPVVVGKDIAERFIAELQAGMFPSVTLPGTYNGDKVRVDVSAVNFQKAYDTYLGCLAALFPANYQQLKASMLHFANDQWKVEGETQATLDLMVGYMALDPVVKKIIIDGHTDTKGRMGHNWEISRLRANAVRDYLVAKGIPAANITSRYWGKTRPVKNTGRNKSEQANRRVLVQLIKG